MTEEIAPRWRNRVLLGLGGLGLAMGLATMDAYLEADQFSLGGWAADLFESVILVSVMLIAASMVMRLKTIETETGQLRRDVDAARTAGAEWRQQSRPTMDQLSAAISDQFDRWSLSPAEADVASLMLKGAALKDIAALRQTSQATIRQQAQAVYRKSGLGNRAELSAFFLEDLLADDPASTAGGGTDRVGPANGGAPRVN
jgi:DNA-binding CsgD family transcriptional regulator